MPSTCSCTFHRGVNLIRRVRATTLSSRLTTYNYRFNDLWRQESELDQPPQRAAINLFSLSEVGQRKDPARNQAQRPPARAGDCLQHSSIEPTPTELAFNHHAQLDTAPFQAYGTSLVKISWPGER